MPLDDILLEAEEKMETAVRILEEEFRTIRTGRASPALVDSLKVECYGTTVPLKQIATTAAPDPRQLVIRPFDRNVAGHIERAILKSDMGLTPQNDGKLIRIAIPPLSEERRSQLVARIRAMAEETRISIRNVRREANRLIEKEQKEGIIPEDNAFKGKDEVQELLKQYEDKVSELLEKKSQEMMES